MGSTIAVHPLSNDPTAAWKELTKTQKFALVPNENPTEEVKPDHVRVVCMSDTHSEYTHFKFDVPQGDIFIHAGDFTMWGQKKEIVEFSQWLKTLPHQHKVVIAGNHELNFDENTFIHNPLTRKDGETVSEMKQYLTDCIYLEDSAVTLYGLKIYGAPWQPVHGDFAFNLPRGEKLLSKWKQIPEDADILVTHGPPLGHGDLLDTGERAGCVELLSVIQKRIKPRYHIFGHIHEGYGISNDGVTTFINASTCNRYYIPKNLPIVFDIKVR